MYQMKGRIRYSEIGYKNELTPVGLVNYFQDCGTFQSEDVGLGLEYLKKIERAWLLSGWQIDIQRMPVLGEEVMVSTWPYDFKGFIGYRNYIMTDTDGNTLAAANAVWTLLDLAKRCPVRVTERDIKGYEVQEKFDMEYLPRRIRTEQEGQSQDVVIVGRERIDTNGHMNNGQYISLAGEYLPEDAVYDRIRVEYKKEVKYGARIIPVVHRMEKSITIVLKNEEAQTHAVVEFGQR